MISGVIFWWIGGKLSAPMWYYLLITISVSVRAIDAYKSAISKKLSK